MTYGMPKQESKRRVNANLLASSQGLRLAVQFGAQKWDMRPDGILVAYGAETSGTVSGMS